jgi:hypothetical protein
MAIVSLLLVLVLVLAVTIVVVVVAVMGICKRIIYLLSSKRRIDHIELVLGNQLGRRAVLARFLCSMYFCILYTGRNFLHTALFKNAQRLLTGLLVHKI